MKRKPRNALVLLPLSKDAREAHNHLRVLSVWGRTYQSAQRQWQQRVAQQQQKVNALEKLHSQLSQHVTTLMRAQKERTPIPRAVLAKITATIPPIHAPPATTSTALKSAKVSSPAVLCPEGFEVFRVEGYRQLKLISPLSEEEWNAIAKMEWEMKTDDERNAFCHRQDR